METTVTVTEVAETCCRIQCH